MVSLVDLKSLGVLYPGSWNLKQSRVRRESNSVLIVLANRVCPSSLSNAFASFRDQGILTPYLTAMGCLLHSGFSFFLTSGKRALKIKDALDKLVIHYGYHIVTVLRVISHAQKASLLHPNIGEGLPWCMIPHGLSKRIAHVSPEWCSWGVCQFNWRVAMREHKNITYSRQWHQ